MLGEVLRFSAHAYISEVFGPKSGWFFQRELSGGGVVANMGSHVLFILGWLFGPIRRVMATTRSHASTVEDSAQALLSFDERRHRHARHVVEHARRRRCSTTASPSTAGKARSSSARERILLHLLAPAGGHEEGWSEIHASDLPADTAFDVSPHIGGEAFYRQLDAFVDACRSGHAALLLARRGRSTRSA